jgi:hypothetical protein
MVDKHHRRELIKTYIFLDKHLDVNMPKRRTTLVLEGSTFDKLMEESLRRYGTSRSVSKVVDTLVEESIGSKEQSILKLLYSKKVAKTTSRELEKERIRLSERFEKLKKTS